MDTDQKNNNLDVIWDKQWNFFEIDENSIFDNRLDCWTEPHKKIVDKYLSYLEPDSCVVEAGCGLGQWVFYCYKKGFHTIGIDLAPETITKLNAYIASRGLFSSRIQFIKDDIRGIASIKDNSCSLILNFGVLEHFEDDAIVLRQFHKILKKGGYAIITVPNLYSSLTITKPISQLLGLWTIGLQRHYSRGRLRKIIPLDKFVIIEEGTLVTSELFGSFANYIPFIGKGISRILHRISKFIEGRSNILGFMRFIVIRKV